MQNAKDSFYLALRSRLAVVNPARVLQLGAVSRPGILVEENEAPTPQPPTDVFVLRWVGLGVNQDLPAMLEAQDCEIFYWTAGSEANQQMDRGRALTEMDAELAAMLQPEFTQKQSVGSQATVTMATNIFWGGATFRDVQRQGLRIGRTATVRVYSLQEQLQNGSVER